MIRLGQTAVLLLQLYAVCGYKFYQGKIPNGDSVPHPCKPNFLWQGVGHENEQGGGIRNPFGLDFAAAGHTWTQALCEKDSDLDGETNGQELGDPDCMWTEGQPAPITVGISHPGFCEPYDSDFCKSVNPTLNCDLEDFKCAALESDPDARNFTVRFPPTAVPPTETNYYCMTFDFDVPGDYHMIATQPFIDNAYVMHHILLFGCEGNAVADPTPKRCGMGAQNCNNIIGLWSVGSNGACFNENIGFRIGENGYKTMALQFHWNNPELRSDYVDSSGMILYYTPNRRVHDAGVLMTGQRYIQIPPGVEQFPVEATCPQQVTKYLVINSGVYFTRAINHMHYLGRSMKIEQFRDGVKLRDITNDEVYSYDDPILYEFDSPIQFLPGDEIKVTCVFKSTNRARTVFYGDGTSDEMCYGFLTFHPVQNMLSPYCVSWKGLSSGLLYSIPEVNGCRQFDFMNVSHPYTSSVYNSIMQNCDVMSNCLSECPAAVQAARQHPCLQGDIEHWLRKRAMDWNLMELLYFFSKLDSCNTEIARNSCPACLSTPTNNNNNNLCISDGPNSASSLIASVAVYIFAALAIKVA